jgi:SseB protein N-terminal domain
LAKLKVDPAAIVELYPALSKEDYLVLVRPGSAKELKSLEFLTYPAGGDIRELPIFTSEKHSLFDRLKKQSGAEVMLVPGVSLFKRMQEIVEDGKIELAINPGWEHGIRINRSILLSVIAVATSL